MNVRPILGSGGTRGSRKVKQVWRGTGRDRCAVGKVVQALWVGFAAAGPFYVLPSGQPQPADWLMAATVVVCFLWGAERLVAKRGLSRKLWPAVGFAAYAALVSAFWTWRLAEPGLLLPAAYYAYNVLVLIALVRTFERLGPAFLRTMGWAFLVSVLIQVSLSMTRLGASFRETAGFNNPNQLGYFALLVASVIALAHCRFGMRRAAAGVGLAGCLWLSAVSLSKAALGGVALLAAMVVKARPLVGLIVCGLVYGAAHLVDLSPVVQNVQQRIVAIGQDSDDSLEARGYDRIWKYPRYLLLGAGEGAGYRFGSEIEVHSSLGTVLFSYGIPGTLLFGGFLARIYRFSGMRHFQYAIPALLYGATHQGLRFTEFWILLGLILCAGCQTATYGAVQQRKVLIRVAGHELAGAK